MKLKLLLLPLFLVSVAFPAYATHEYVLDLESGSSQFAYVNNDLGITGGNVTISVWFKLESEATGAVYTLFQTQDGGNKVGYYIRYLDSSGIKLVFERERMWVANCTITVSGSLYDGNWHHAVGTYDGSYTNLYLDGELVGGPVACSGNGSNNGADGTSVGSMDAASGGTYTPTNYYFDGLIDDVSVYSVALNSGQVNALEDVCTVSTSNLLALWEFENDFVDGQGTFDLAGVGSPTFVTELEHGCTGVEPPASTATSTGATTTEAILKEGFISVVFGLAVIQFLLMLFVSGYLYNNLIKPTYER